MCRNKIIEIVVPEAARDWAITRVSTRDILLGQILGLAQMRPMLAERQVLIIDGAEHVEKLGENLATRSSPQSKSYVTSPAPFTVLVIEATALDGRQKFPKCCTDTRTPSSSR